MTEGGVQTKDERELADRALEVLRVRPNQSTMTLCGNLNMGQKKSNLVTTDQVYRACASDDRIVVVMAEGLVRYFPKEGV